MNTDSDPLNCGVCGRGCAAGDTCRLGSCTGPGMDAGPDPVDGGPTGCTAGTHPCGPDCVADRANLPENGCRLGCGGACIPPSMGASTCSSGGACDFTCTPPSMRVGGGCSGGGCAPDAAEPNDTEDRAYAFADFADYPDSSMTFTVFRVHASTDTDWYRFVVHDYGLDGNPIVRVTLDNIPSGSDFDLGAYYKCNAVGVTTATCRSGGGSPDLLATGYQGCTSSAGGSASETAEFDTECAGSDESGVVLVRVLPYSWSGSCDSYSLRVDVW